MGRERGSMRPHYCASISDARRLGSVGGIVPFERCVGHAGRTHGVLRYGVVSYVRAGFGGVCESIATAYHRPLAISPFRCVLLHSLCLFPLTPFEGTCTFTPMQFTLSIELGNAAMQTNGDVAGALREVASKLDRYGCDAVANVVGFQPWYICDGNGSTIGRWLVEDDPSNA